MRASSSSCDGRSPRTVKPRGPMCASREACSGASKHHILSIFSASRLSVLRRVFVQKALPVFAWYLHNACHAGRVPVSLYVKWKPPMLKALNACAEDAAPEAGATEAAAAEFLLCELGTSDISWLACGCWSGRAPCCMAMARASSGSASGEGSFLRLLDGGWDGAEVADDRELLELLLALLASDSELESEKEEDCDTAVVAALSLSMAPLSGMAAALARALALAANARRPEALGVARKVGPRLCMRCPVGS